MSLPFYTINRDEVIPLVVELIKTSSIKAKLIGTGGEESTPPIISDISTQNLEDALKRLAYMIEEHGKQLLKNHDSMEEIVREVGRIKKEIIEKQMVSHITSFTAIHESMEFITRVLDQILLLLNDGFNNVSYETRNLSITTSNLPVEYSANTTVGNKHVMFYGITVTLKQEDVNFFDSFTLKLNNRVIMEKSAIKAPTQYIRFSQPVELEPNQKIEVVFNNNSSKQKIIRVDFDYLDVTESITRN